MAMSEIGVSFETLCDLAKLSQQNGTTNAFIPVALQWAGKANTEIDRLIAEVERLNIQQISDVTLSDWSVEHLKVIDELRKENRELRTALDNMTEVARLAQEAAATAETRAVTRCVEIADGYSSCEGIAEKVADAIKKEYGL